jgi:iron complex transport system substrate-binding protein
MMKNHKIGSRTEKGRLKKLVSIFLALTLLTVISASSEVSVEAATRTVVDHAGHTVELPTEINRIVILNILPLASVYVLFEGNADKLVGIHPSAYAAAKNSFLPKVAPDILNVNTDFVNGEDINIEELLKLKPDVMFYQAEDQEQYRKLADAGLPAIGFSTKNYNFNTIDTFAGWVDLLGEVLGKGNKAAGIVEYGRNSEAEIKATLDAVGSALEKPRSLILFHYNGVDLKPSGDNFFGGFWLETTGAVNVAAEIDGWPQVNIEQIYAWNPDIIFLTNFSPYQPEDLYNNNIDGYDWSNVRAVQDHKVYKFPLGMYRWFPPSSDSPLALWWLAKTIHPELFEDVDLNQKVKDYYKEFYGVELSNDDVEQIFHPSSAAAAKPTK